MLSHLRGVVPGLRAEAYAVLILVVKLSDKRDDKQKAPESSPRRVSPKRQHS